jgi:heterogeneous nuclear rnp K-like protein 2
VSGSRISIAKVPHDETGERMFTIVGNAEQTETALVLIFNQVRWKELSACGTKLTRQLESEKQRRTLNAPREDMRS